jgi:hypothetical protein
MTNELWKRTKSAMDRLGVSEEEDDSITLAAFVRTLKDERDALRERLSLYDRKPAKAEPIEA